MGGCRLLEICERTRSRLRWFGASLWMDAKSVMKGIVIRRILEGTIKASGVIPDGELSESNE
jgi:hypothetical protein